MLKNGHRSNQIGDQKQQNQLTVVKPQTAKGKRMKTKSHRTGQLWQNTEDRNRGMVNAKRQEAEHMHVKCMSLEQNKSDK